MCRKAVGVKPLVVHKYLLEIDLFSKANEIKHNALFMYTHIYVTVLFRIYLEAEADEKCESVSKINIIIIATYLPLDSAIIVCIYVGRL